MRSSEHQAQMKNVPGKQMEQPQSALYSCCVIIKGFFRFMMKEVFSLVVLVVTIKVEKHQIGGVYNELYNGPEQLNRDTKNSRSRVINGQLNIGLNVHGFAFANLCKEETQTWSDGLSFRILPCYPLPNSNLENQSLGSSISRDTPKVSFASILYMVSMFCETPLRFKLTKDGFERFDELNLFFRKVTARAN